MDSLSHGLALHNESLLGSGVGALAAYNLIARAIIYHISLVGDYAEAIIETPVGVVRCVGSENILAEDKVAMVDAKLRKECRRQVALED